MRTKGRGKTIRGLEDIGWWRRGEKGKGRPRREEERFICLSAISPLHSQIAQFPAAHPGRPLHFKTFKGVRTGSHLRPTNACIAYLEAGHRTLRGTVCMFYYEQRPGAATSDACLYVKRLHASMCLCAGYPSMCMNPSTSSPCWSQTLHCTSQQHCRRRGRARRRRAA